MQYMSRYFVEIWNDDESDSDNDTVTLEVKLLGVTPDVESGSIYHLLCVDEHPLYADRYYATILQLDVDDILGMEVATKVLRAQKKAKDDKLHQTMLRNTPRSIKV